ncbi:phosphocholine cytidylyltransferase family protein [Pseudodesulfovibrio sp. zrk46]|uniref:phosphocholine cytidylyltransferase family protein n=1 Tax=Pseudodesulfovibrio sp. zrk46 TaxID=2725288 RepID=UPI001449F78D|nr:phosphocholine cytidylyltransferase family protein [Pseudodesulfovibrio sp. zrk46]QJB55730.1 phosphocholine cytidylyltransferase family protein [Pseudodesulfovibrio sp. zrk46]
MQALILAAGRGSRMCEETRDKPKCLIPLSGKPMLHWQLQSLQSAGLETITVATGYKGHLLTGEFKTVENPVWDKTNMVSTMLCALPELAASPCIISYSDIVYHPDHVRALAGADGDISITYDREWKSLWSVRFDNPLDDAETFREQDGILQDIGRRTDSYEDIQGQFMGLLKFSADGFEQVKDLLGSLSEEEVAKLDMTALLQRLLAAGAHITAVPVSGQWCEADSMEDVTAYEKCIREHENNKTRWSHDWR